MTRLLERYFSFSGRIARLPFFIRCLYLNIAMAVLLFASIPLLANGSRLWWWAGVAELIASTAVFSVGIASLFVRRLHDLGFSGYHATWVVAADILSTALSYGPDYVLLLALPLFAINLWIGFWPGNRDANRFGEAPK